MRYSPITLIAVILLNYLPVNSQTDISIRKKDFKTDKPGFSDAWKHISAGDAFFGEKGIWYKDAYNEYLQALVYNNANAGLNYKTGVSALFSDNKEEAAGFFLKAIELNRNISDDVLFLAGRSLQFAGRYGEAIEKYSSYLSLTGKKAQRDVFLARQYLQECNSALLVMKDTLRISIDNLGANINSNSDEYSEVFSHDGKVMYFASRRQMPKSGNRLRDSKFDENIFVSNLYNGSWGSSNLAGKDITTKYCEAPLFLTATNEILYIYTGYSNNGDIKASVKKKGEWKSPKPLALPVNSRSSETSFTIAPSGNEIYFVSAKGKGSVGGKDIYYIKKMSDRKWSRPINAGTVINTIYDEESVSLSVTGDTLWFSSRGHNSVGGYDIFYSMRKKSGVWDTVANMGYPVNTPWDDICFCPSQVDDSSFYFASNRSGGFGGLDIYHGQILPAELIVAPPAPAKPDTVIVRDTVVVIKEVAPPPPVMPLVKPETEVYLVGRVRDSETGDPILAKIDIKSLASGEVVGTTASSDLDGSYHVQLPAKKPYMIDIRATGFLSDTKRIDVPENWSKETYNLNIELIKVKVGKKVVLNNILFETGKAVLTAGSYTELNRLLNIMKENSMVKIEISGHTDKTGSEPLNFRLSEARAKAVVDYLIKNGIDKARMEYRGYGSLQPISDNTSSAGRAKNRRVEFKILEF